LAVIIYRKGTLPMLKQKVFSICFAILLASSFNAWIRAAETVEPEYLSESLSSSLLTASQDWGELGFNTSAFAVPGSALKLRIKDKKYARGLGQHANGEIVVDLGGQFKEFQTEVGIQWQGGGTPGSVIFQIYADDKKVFDSGVVRENDPPRPVSVSVEGANELRLVASDAGDGITSDCADWADARLTRNPAAGKRTPRRIVDIAPFGQVATWDPQVMTGTKAGRVQEMPAEDIQTAKELLPTSAGTYLVPSEKETGCIGLQWPENRLLRSVVLEFADAATLPAGSIQLQFWTGESAWQGGWQPTNIKPEKTENSWVWTFGMQEIPRGTQKVRWIFSDAKKPIELKGIHAFTRSRWNTVDVRLESTNAASPKKAEIELYNGIIPGQPGKAAYHCTWDTSTPLSLKVLSSAAQRYKADRTVLRITFPETAFGIAVEDLQANDCVYVPHAGVFATRTPAPVTLVDYLKKISDKKTVLEEVRQKPDQDFSKAWAAVHRPVVDMERTMLSLANDNRKYVVSREGAISFEQYDLPKNSNDANFKTIYDLKFSAPWHCVPVFGSGNNLRISRHPLHDWLPIFVTVTQDGSTEYQQTTFVAPFDKAAADAPNWLRERAVFVAGYRATNGGKESSDVRLALNFSHENNLPFQLQEVKDGVLVVAGDRLIAWIDASKAAPLSLSREGGNVILSGKLSTGATAECFAYLPAWKLDPKDYTTLTDSSDLMSKTETYWKSLFEPAMQIDIPDKLLSDIIRASQVHCMLAARNEQHGKTIAPWTASIIYGPLESESNSIIRGMDMTGHEDFARRGLDFMLSRCTPEGFITTGYTIVGTGEVLWTLGEYYGRTHDRQWLQKVAPDVVRVCKWVMKQREKTKLLDARGEKQPFYGLMTPGVSADWNRFAFRLFNDSQYYAGLELAGQALADVGEPAATEILADAKSYRSDIDRAYHWMQARMPVQLLNDGTWVPGDPSILNCFGPIEYFIPAEDVGRTWAYSIELGGHQLAATKVLDPASRDAGWMIDFLEDVQFLRTGMGDYPEEQTRKDIYNLGGFGKVQPYYARNGEIYAFRDDVKPYIRSYFNTIPSLVNVENLSFCEHFHNFGAWNKTHETGWFLCQTAIMFVTERGDELWLAPFVTNQWLKDGLKVSVQNAPTRFGKVSYTINSAVAKGQIEATVQLPPKCTAKKIVLRLRHPDGKPIQSVTVQGKPHTDFDPKKETITFTPADEKIIVRAQY
jgi:hypothetical protein